ncbi:MAG: hypothetical protein NTX45_02460 [Proteobacteria bacterium]|nr:hypothetical protein [Pseudomonadota bacterium]
MHGKQGADLGGKFRVSVEKLEGVWQDKVGNCRVSEKKSGGYLQYLCGHCRVSEKLRGGVRDLVGNYRI